MLLVAQALGSIIMYFIFKRETKNTIDSIFGQPIVKGAMSVLGKKSGEVRHESAMMDQVATQLLSNPKVQVLKSIGKQLGFDVDQMIEEQGAASVVEQVLAGADMLGIDVASILSGELNSAGSQQTSTDNPYLG